MTFAIEFLDEPITGLASEERAEYGQITIGDFHERIYIPTCCWTQSDYIAQWVEALQRFISDEQPTSALVTEMHEPSKGDHLTWWLLYREGDKAYIQNQLLFFDTLPEEFQLSNLYAYVNQRETISDSGDEISEWTVSIADLKGWLHKLKG